MNKDIFVIWILGLQINTILIMHANIWDVYNNAESKKNDIMQLHIEFSLSTMKIKCNNVRL